jgi:hypothetical protein
MYRHRDDLLGDVGVVEDRVRRRGNEEQCERRRDEEESIEVDSLSSWSCRNSNWTFHVFLDAN